MTGSSCPSAIVSDHRSVVLEVRSNYPTDLSALGSALRIVVPVPRPSLRAAMVPPWASTMSFAMARPTPVPSVKDVVLALTQLCGDSDLYAAPIFE